MNTNKFHEHLDECEQCRENPLALCSTGAQLLDVECFGPSSEYQAWNTEQVFKPVSEWDEEEGDALFFKLDAGEPPVVTSPISSDWDNDYFTHWMPLPDEFKYGYRMACIKSGIVTKVK